jgi:hypothetical protein
MKRAAPEISKEVEQNVCEQIRERCEIVQFRDLQHNRAWPLFKKMRRELLNRHVVDDAVQTLFKNLSGLYLLCYKLRRDSKWVEPVWEIFAPEEYTNLFVKLDEDYFRTHLLLGCALIQGEAKSGLPVLRDSHTFFDFLPVSDWTMEFYDLLNEMFPSLVVTHNVVVYRSNVPERILEDTQTRWGDRDLAELGYGPEVTWTFPVAEEQNVEPIINAIISNANTPRTHAIVYFHLAFDADFPILEAISHFWPGQMVERINERDIYFTLKWETKSICLARHDIPDRTILLFVDPPIADQWRFERKTWPAIFASFGIQLKGAVFGILV